MSIWNDDSDKDWENMAQRCLALYIETFVYESGAV